MVHFVCDRGTSQGIELPPAVRRRSIVLGWIRKMLLSRKIRMRLTGIGCRAMADICVYRWRNAVLVQGRDSRNVEPGEPIGWTGSGEFDRVAWWQEAIVGPMDARIRLGLQHRKPESPYLRMHYAAGICRRSRIDSTSDARNASKILL